ncbi:MAG: hypothetical protein JW965_01470 [Bacteroidales bacterium]|nr:hypothetical protein [Bacteroidales bacterium]
MIEKYITILLVAILATGRGGETSYEIEFTELDTGTIASIRALHVVSEDVIWASGTGGTYLVSVDRGETWKVGTIPGASEDDFRSLHAWNDMEAIVFGISRPGRAYYTADGGVSWDIVYENNAEGIFFDSAVFADENTGLALSDPLDSTSFLIRTSDRGRSWSELNNMPVLNAGEYNFAASNSCIDYHADGNIWIITGGSAARVFISNDHGISWTARETGLVHGNPSSGNFSVSFCDSRNGIVVGGTYDKPELNEKIAAWSSDGGDSWQLSETMPREYRSCIVWMQDEDSRLAFAIGKTGCDYSLDNGNTWLPGSDDEGYYTARPVPGTLTGFAAGAEGKISRFRIEKVEKVE